jgi:hypothetical protein
MVANVPVKRAIEVFGHAHCTRTQELVWALRKLKIRCASRLERRKKAVSLPAFCIISLKVRRDHEAWPKNKRWGHWAVLYKNRIYDPAWGIDPAWPPGIHITSYLRIKP